jgi:pimeloyl-ACP methyl ester carboxylesterase
MPTATGSGVRIAYDDLSRGEPALLFLPGWCAPRTAFRELLPSCAVRRRVLCLDWRGHGESGDFSGDFGNAGLVEDALAVIHSSGAQSVIPVALAHAGWVAIELRRRLEARVPAIICLDWFVLGAPPPFLETLEGLKSPDRWQHVLQALFDRWLQGTEDAALAGYVRQEMGAFGFPMWARAAREILWAFARERVPLTALSRLGAPVLHLYAQPSDDEYLAAQQEFSRRNPWFRVVRLEARTHFPMFEVPGEMAAAIDGFLAGRSRR